MISDNKSPWKTGQSLIPRPHGLSSSLTKDLSGQADRINIYNLFPLSGDVYRETIAQRPMGLQ